MEFLSFKVVGGENERLDTYVAKRVGDLSRSEIKKLIKNGEIKVNNKEEKVSYIVKEEDKIEIKITKKEDFKLIPQDLNLEVLYEDDYIAVINKPYGMVVHPGPGNERGTLVNGLLSRFKKLANMDDPIRPGIVHRLDKDTSGLLVIAKDNKAYEKLVETFKKRDILRTYNALVFGRIKNKTGKIQTLIGRHPVNRQKMAVLKSSGKEAITRYEVVDLFDKYTYIEASLETGRTHQIRVHMNYINHPIVGDPVYSNGKNEFGLKRQFLHSSKIGFDHPITGKYMVFKSELPKEFNNILEGLKKRRDSQ